MVTAWYARLRVNPGDYLEHLVHDQVGTAIGTGLLWITQRWPSNAVGGPHVGCSSPTGEAPLSQLLPHRGMGVLHVRSSLLSFFAVLGWFGKVETLSTATWCVGALLHHWWNLGYLLHDGRSSTAACAAARADSIRQADPLLGLLQSNPRPAPVTLPKRNLPGLRALSLVPWPWEWQASPAASELQHRLKARRSLGALPPDGVGVRSKKRRREEKKSRRKTRKRVDGHSSSVTSVTDEAGVFFAWPRHGMATAFRSRVSGELGRLLASGVQHIETGEDDLTSCVVQYLEECVSWSTPASDDELSEESGTANHRRVSRRFACW